MVEFKQEMPPPGGYAPITFERVPLKKGLSAVSKLGIYLAVTGASLYQFFCDKERINNNRIEMRCNRLALRPMLEAESDRAQLKQLRRNREEEEKIMKDVKGWEVGKWKHSPVYLTLGPDEFFVPNVSEYFAHNDPSVIKEAISVLRFV